MSGSRRDAGRRTICAQPRPQAARRSKDTQATSGSRRDAGRRTICAQPRPYAARRSNKLSVITRPWSRLSLAGKILLPLFLLFVLLNVLLIAGWMTGLLPALIDLGGTIVNDNIDIVRFVVAVTAVLLFTVPTAFVIIFMEMKIIAFINSRIGPNRIGPWGTLSSAIHGFKVLAKEDFTPTGADAA